MPPEENEFSGRKWTQWDHFVVENGNELSLRQIIHQLRETESVNVEMMSYDTLLLFMAFMSEEKKAERLSQTVPEIIEARAGKKLPAGTRSLEIALAVEDEDPDGNALDVPNLKLIL